MNAPRVDLRPHGDRETLLLLDCARRAIDPATAESVRGHVTAGLNWERFLALAQRHGLAPLAYLHLQQICAGAVPAEALAFLRDYAQRNTAFAAMLTGELVRLVTRLEAAGITAIPYKGPAIAVKLYGGIARRQYADLDMFVRRRDVAETARLLEAEGFEPVPPIPRSRYARLLRDAYVWMFYCAASRTLLELHWDVAERHWALRFDAEAMWQRLEPLQLPGATVMAPCAEDLLLLLCIHGVRHESDKLEGIASIAELVRSRPGLDWDRVWRQSQATQCRRIVAFGLLLAQGLFGVPLPPEAAAVTRSPALEAMARMTVRHLTAADAPSRTWRRQVPFQLRLKDRRADQARYWTRLLTSTPDDWAAVPLPEPLSFAYPLVRAIRLARK